MDAGATTEPPAETQPAEPEGAVPAEPAPEETLTPEVSTPAEEVPAEPTPEEVVPAEEQPAAAVELSAEQSAQLTSLTQLYLRAWERAYADGGAPATDVNMVGMVGSSVAIDTQLVRLALGIDGEGLEGFYAQNDQPNLAGFAVSAADGFVHATYDVLPAILSSVYGGEVGDVSSIVTPMIEAGTAQDVGDGWSFAQVSGAQSSAAWIANVHSSDGTTYSFDVALLVGAGMPDIASCELRYFHVEAVVDEASAFGFHLVSATEAYGLEGAFPDAVRIQADAANASTAGTPLAQPVTDYR